MFCIILVLFMSATNTYIFSKYGLNNLSENLSSKMYKNQVLKIFWKKKKNWHSQIIKTHYYGAQYNKSENILLKN